MTAGAGDVAPAAGFLSRDGYVLELDEDFGRPDLDHRRWLPCYLPHWSSRSASRARYEVGGGLRLRIDPDQTPWAPAIDPGVVVSALQTGEFAGPVGSSVGQHRFREGLTVTEEQPVARLYTPTFGLIEARASAVADPAAMVGLWLIGFEDEPDRSGELCVFEIFGRDVRPDRAVVGMGIHPFGDTRLRDDFRRIEIPMDAREPHWYAAQWTPDGVAFSVDERIVTTVPQSPAYPMQLMLTVYRFDAEATTGPRSITFAVDRVRGWRPREMEPVGRGSAIED